MPSFDIVSKTDLSEVANAIANMEREMEQRYDFKGSNCRIERSDAEITLNADDDLKLRQMREMLQGHLARRKVDCGRARLSAGGVRRPARPSGKRPSSGKVSTVIWPKSWSRTSRPPSSKSRLRYRAMNCG